MHFNSKISDGLVGFSTWIEDPIVSHREAQKIAKFRRSDFSLPPMLVLFTNRPVQFEIRDLPMRYAHLMFM
jgi:hypothetical protein